MNERMVRRGGEGRGEGHYGTHLIHITPHIRRQRLQRLRLDIRNIIIHPLNSRITRTRLPPPRNDIMNIHASPRGQDARIRIRLVSPDLASVPAHEDQIVGGGLLEGACDGGDGGGEGGGVPREGGAVEEAGP